MNIQDIPDSHPDIGYRIFCPGPPTLLFMYTPRKWVSTKWYTTNSCTGGDRGVFYCLANAMRKARRDKLSSFSIWKFHIGLPDSEIPFFPPTKVYEQ